MGVMYDTSDIRRSARQIGDASDQLSTVASEVGRLVSAVPDALQGESGDALEELLSKLQADMKRMSGGLGAVSSQLKAFAAYLDRLDQEAARNIRSS